MLSQKYSLEIGGVTRITSGMIYPSCFPPSILEIGGVCRITSTSENCKTSSKGLVVSPIPFPPQTSCTHERLEAGLRGDKWVRE